MSENDDGEPPSDQTMQFIWVVLLVAIGVYGGVALFVARSGPVRWEEMSFLVYALGAIAATEPFVIVVLRNMLFFSPLDSGEYEDEDEVAEAYSTMSIVSWALAESIAIYGLMAAMLTRLVELFFPFAAIGVGLLLYFRYELDPQLERFEEVVADRDADEVAEEW